MKTRFLPALLLSASATLGLSAPVGAAAYPDRVITFVTPTAAGGGTDLVARLLGEKLGPLLGQAIVVSNKPGAGGVVGTQSLKRERNDGYNLLVTANSNQLIVPWIYKGVNFDPIEDFEPVAMLGTMPFVLTVAQEFPADTFEEFLQLMKAHPGQYRYASAGSGTLNHLIPEMLMQQADINMEHIPYRGAGPAMTDVIGGQVSIYFGSLPSVLENVRGGRLKALAVASAKRTPVLPDVPAIAELVPGFESDLWVAMYAPKGTSAEIIQLLNQQIAKAMQDPALLATYRMMGMEALYEDAQGLAARQEAEYKVWGDIVSKVGVTSD